MMILAYIFVFIVIMAVLYLSPANFVHRASYTLQSTAQELVSPRFEVHHVVVVRLEGDARATVK